MDAKTKVEALKKSIWASLSLMRGPTGERYDTQFMRGGPIWLWDSWYVDFQNTLHDVLLWSPSKEQVKALKALNRQAFGRVFPHLFMRGIIKIKAVII